MKKNITKRIITIAIIAFVILITSTSSFAGITPGDIKGGNHGDIDLSFLDTITDAVRLIGTFIAVGALMIIGIKYVMGSIEEKASYKKSMMPYIIGCFILFGASTLAPQIRELFSQVGTDTEAVGGQILGIIQAVGSMITVGVLMILGIKYMVGSTEERASYKRSMLPAVIGMILIFMALQITTIIYDFTKEAVGEEVPPTSYSPGQAIQDANNTLQGLNSEQKRAKLEEARQKYVEAERKDPQSDETKYWKAYYNQLYEATRWTDL